MAHDVKDLIQRLEAYKHSMTEFDEEEMEFLIMSVKSSIKAGMWINIPPSTLDRP